MNTDATGRLPSCPAVALDIRTDPEALVGTPLATGLRGGGPDADVLWRARTRDDDGRVWQSQAYSAIELGTSWTPAKASSGVAANRRSLHPLEIEVRAELDDGRTSARTVRRRLVADGVRVRRWRGEKATLYLPHGDPQQTVLIDATSDEPEWLVPASAVLASQGAIVLTATAGADIEKLQQQLAAVPGAGEIQRLTPPQPPTGFPTSKV